VKRIAALIILGVYLLSATAFSEVLKLPFLLKHFKEHQASDPAMGIADFLSMHYFHDDGNDSDNEEERKLPFMSEESSSTNDISISHSKALSFTYSYNHISPPKEKNLFFCSAFAFRIWQPPRRG
jgi:hypothetical protein